MGNPRCSPAFSNPRMERKIIEKNRRNRMKNLYFNLFSLLPNLTSKVEGLALPDQMDEVVEYIKSLNMKLEKMRQYKSQLPRTKSESCIKSENQAKQKRTPLIEVHDMGPIINIILTNGLDDFSTFHDIIRLLHQYGFEIASASFSRDGNSIIHLLQDKDGQSKSGFESATISRKLEELVCGSSSSEAVESHWKLWDYEIPEVKSYFDQL